MGSHKIWRTQAKKMRRKRIRQKLAQERDEAIKKELEIKNKCPRYQAWLSEQRALEIFAEEEEARLAAERHAAWVEEEERAQKAWKERQDRLAVARAERAKQELRIKEEWEEEQRKIKAAAEEQEKIAEKKKQQQEKLMRQIENFINKGCDMPPEVNVASMTNPDKPACPFFSKTGACRFADRCSRNHTRPAISRVLLVPNFYDHIGLRQMNPDELEAADDWLEYEDSETYHHFLDFYEDVLPEWERVGQISQFKVCCNFEPHLRGNVYIEYDSAQDAVKAFKMFHGRFYGGKQINVEFVTIDSWKAAICGQFHKNCCPKGRACNFLHVFRNPRNAFYAADRDQQEWRRSLNNVHKSSPRRGQARSWSGSPENSRRGDWRWSASPSPPSEEQKPDSKRSHHSGKNSSHRIRTKRRREGSSESHGRSRAKVKRYDRNSGRHSPRRNYTESSIHEVASRRDSSSSISLSKSSDSKLSEQRVDGCVNEEANCDKSNQSVADSKHISYETESDQDSNPKSRTKVKKAKKKKDSHRKEKRRKKRHYRSGSESSD
ncbi:U2 small nuclear ribonucleoprotein auxiliary factor 35 kDa subunit-related protein 1 isoform X3 [Frankliniella occidentalis]|uniref:Beta-keto thiolase n=1 Tax=Frankliniella occidentalis TaxID=133901 RepID=A0A6J1SJF4_FRAOC|nr:U2 small nuclear ribonucleoprotein auxiliary factor 35 kDa subunit-related protein 1 isoform X3 [Frankliniella occidentalis]UYW66166.1 beta-keto thiolase [Frankliniella occidentalis]